jgi:hypothetical protein
MAITNQIFEYYRAEKNKEKKAVKLLISKGYTISGERGNIITEKTMKNEGSW